MNAPVQINPKAADSATIHAVNAWRGACLQSFAEAEEAVCEALVALNAVDERGLTVKLGHLIGQKLEDLSNAIGPDGPFSDEGKAAFKALADFRSHEDIRAHLAHGVAYSFVERNGEWVVVFRSLAVRSGKPERETRTIDKAEALAMQKALRSHTQSLCDNLRNLVGRFRA
jgi:hypothetical protein